MTRRFNVVLQKNLVQYAVVAVDAANEDDAVRAAYRLAQRDTDVEWTDGVHSIDPVDVNRAHRCEVNVRRA